MNKYFIAFLTLLFFVLLYFLAPILTPFLVGALLAYLVSPIVNKLMSLRLPRILAVVTVFLVVCLVMVLLIVLVVPLVQAQIDNLIDAIPDMVVWIQSTVVPWLKDHFGAQNIINVESLKTQLTQNWTKAGGVAGWVVTTVFHSSFALLHGLLNLILTLVVAFYLLYDWEKFLTGLRNLLPHKYAPTIIKLVTECNEVLGAFFRGQLLVMLALGIFYSIALTLVGLKMGLIIGILVGLLAIIPYLGIIVGITAASIAAFVQFGTLTSIAPVLVVFAIGQLLDGMFVTPKLVGGRIGLHPIAVIFAVLAGGVLFGFFGVLLALPVAAIIMVLVRFVNLHYHSSQLSQ